jgi:hypothetical protein
MAPWAGTFTSSDNPGWWILKGVCGRIEVDVPDDLETLDATARFTYTGFYRLGHTSEFAFKYVEKHGQGEQLGVHFKGTSKGNQTIDFDVSCSDTKNIWGTYVSVNPGDSGNFELTRK